MDKENEHPSIAGKAPILVDVEEGEIYWWCACGKSSKQPFCDGSHKGTPLFPQLNGWQKRTAPLLSVPANKAHMLPCVTALINVSTNP